MIVTVVELKVVSVHSVLKHDRSGGGGGRRTGGGDGGCVSEIVS